MVKVRITEFLFREIEKKFRGETYKVIDLLEMLENNPKKRKTVGQVAGVLIKELKYKSFRFYFIIDGYRIKFLEVEELRDLIIKFVGISNKKTQQKVIDDIKHILRNLGDGGF